MRKKKESNSQPGKGLKEGRVEVIVPTTVDEDVERINGNQVRERVFIVYSTKWCYLHRCPHEWMDVCLLYVKIIT